MVDQNHDFGLILFPFFSFSVGFRSFLQPEILDASANATYVIRMHEQYWKYHFDGKNVDRAIFMTALENIKLISIRVTTALKFNHVL